MITNGVSVENRRGVAAPYELALKLTRNAIRNEDLRISREFNISDIAGGLWSSQFGPCRILCVDSPLLLLEAVALDPSAAVFLPLHIVVSADGPKTHVYWLNPANMHTKRLPVGAMLPMRALQTRIIKAMDRLPVNTESCLEMSCER
jgi:hypothetical protein